MDLPEIADLWPAIDPVFRNVTLRAFCPEDANMAMELSRDPYVPATGTLPFNATPDQAQQWIQRQQPGTQLAQASPSPSSTTAKDAARDPLVCGCASCTPVARRSATVLPRRSEAGVLRLMHSVLSHPSPGHFPSCIARSSTSSHGTRTPSGQRSEPGISEKACSGPTRKFPVSDATCCCTPTFATESGITLGVHARAMTSQPRPGA